MDGLQQTIDSVQRDLRATQLHKAAFRTAFDYLTEMWPPTNSADYFTLAAVRADARCAAVNNDELARKMLVLILEYIIGLALQQKPEEDAPK